MKYLIVSHSDGSSVYNVCRDEEVRYHVGRITVEEDDGGNQTYLATRFHPDSTPSRFLSFEKAFRWIERMDLRLLKEEKEASLREATEALSKVLKKHHDALVDFQGDLGEVLTQLEEISSAPELYEQTLEMQNRLASAASMSRSLQYESSEPTLFEVFCGDK